MTRIILSCFALIMLASGLGCQSSGGQSAGVRGALADRYSVYVSNDGKLTHFNMDPENGQLTRASAIAVGASPGSIAVHPSRLRLYVAIRLENRLASLAINPADGSLTSVNSIDVGARAAYVTVDRTGRWLLSAYYSDNFIAVHRINNDGSIDPKLVQRIDTQIHPHCIKLDASNQTALVPNTGSQIVMQFSFDQNTGILSPKTPFNAPSDPGVIGPRHLWFHPTLPTAYTSNEQGKSVTAYNFNVAAGTLQRFQTLSTLPANYQGKNSCADIEVSPDGRFVFVSNRGHDSIARYLVDQASGRLVALGQTSTEATPRSFNVDPTSRYMYVAGQKSGKLAAYRIHPQTGDLEYFETHNVPNDPSWVQVVNLPDIQQ